MPTSAIGKPQRPNPQAGTALIDVLVALVVLGLGLTALLHLLGGAAGLGHGAEQQARALAVAENQLALAVSGTIGPFTRAGREDGFDWALQSQPETLASAGAPLVPYLLTITVSQQGREALRLATTRLGPP